MHKLLRRQLRLARSDDGGAMLDLDRFLALVEGAYEEVDRERRIMQHAYQVMRDEQATLAERQMRHQETVAQIRAEKAEAERARAMAEAALLKQERLSVLGQLTATVAHELRNPLSAIRNSLHALRTIAANQDLPLDRPMMRIERSITRCDGIINDLLDFTRTHELALAPTALDGWLAEVLDEQKVPDDIALEYRPGAPDAVVQLDCDRFRRVIINLVENAIHALAGSTRARRIVVATAADAVAEIAIADTGPGIPADILPRVFEPLFSTKSFGTGLGLPTVKQIVEHHGGTITIASPPGEGATVSIGLPLGQSAA